MGVSRTKKLSLRDTHREDQDNCKALHWLSEAVIEITDRRFLSGE